MYKHEASDSPDTEQQTSQSLEESGTTQPAGLILEQDRFLPIANISRIMKRVVPAEGKLSKEAKECVQECITEFLLFITSEASERCSIEKRKTISGEDILTAFRTLGFDEYLKPLEEFLNKYREANKLQTSQAATLIHSGNAAINAQPQQQEQIVEEDAVESPAPANNDSTNQPVMYLQEQPMVNTGNLQPVQLYYANGQYFIPVQQQQQDGNNAQPLWPMNFTAAIVDGQKGIPFRKME